MKARSVSISTVARPRISTYLFRLSGCTTHRVTRSSAMRLRYFLRLVVVEMRTTPSSNISATGLVDMRPSGRMVVMNAVGQPASRGSARSGIAAGVVIRLMLSPARNARHEMNLRARFQLVIRRLVVDVPVYHHRRLLKARAQPREAPGKFIVQFLHPRR